MSTKSYSQVNTIKKQQEYLGRRLDKYAKFYWRGEDMWDTYHTFITNNGSALKFVNGPSFSNEYSSPQYDHAMGNLTGVKFSRMQVSFTICTYGVTAEEYRSLIAALGPYEIDYLSFAYDNNLCYLAKTTGMKEAVKTVIGVDNGKDLYMAENTITFEIQGEQCALAQRQYVWTQTDTYITDGNVNTYYILGLPKNSSGLLPSDLLPFSELSFGIVSEVSFYFTGDTSTNAYPSLRLYIGPDVNEIVDTETANKVTKYCDLLCEVDFMPQTENWQDTEQINGEPTSFNQLDRTISIKYDSTSGLVFLQYGDSDYKVLNLLLTNTYGDLMVNDMKTTKMKVNKNEEVGDIYLYWEFYKLSPLSEDSKIKAVSYGRAKAILV